jgi:phage N-6-adenine-methyltransferase
MPKNKANYTETRRDDWGTPRDLFDSLNSVFKFAVDLAADARNTLCTEYCSIENGDNGFFDLTAKDFEHLKDAWCWCNPPYGHAYGGLEKWITEIHAKVPKSVVLIPAATGNKWWQRAVWPNARKITFIRGRLQFDGAPQVAQFDSALLTLGRYEPLTDDEHAKLVELGACITNWCIA